MTRRRREFDPAVRAAALRRAVYRCEQCGSKQDLELHHIGHPRDVSLFNAEVVCADCHLAEHRRPASDSQRPPIAPMGWIVLNVPSGTSVPKRTVRAAYNSCLTIPMNAPSMRGGARTGATRSEPLDHHRRMRAPVTRRILIQKIIGCLRPPWLNHGDFPLCRPRASFAAACC